MNCSIGAKFTVPRGQRLVPLQVAVVHARSSCSSSIPVPRALAYDVVRSHSRTETTGAAGMMMDVEFSIPYVTHVGQEICMVGNSASLGCWDVTQAIAMEWTAGHVWKGMVRLSADEHLAYKYVVKQMDGSVVWQPGQDMGITFGQGEFDHPASRMFIEDRWDASFRAVTSAGPPLPRMTTSGDGLALLYDFSETAVISEADILAAATMEDPAAGAQALLQRLTDAGLSPDEQLELLNTSVDQAFALLDEELNRNVNVAGDTLLTNEREGLGSNGVLLDSRALARKSIEMDRKVAQIADAAVRMVRAIEAKEEELAGLLRSAEQDLENQQNL